MNEQSVTLNLKYYVIQGDMAWYCENFNWVDVGCHAVALRNAMREGGGTYLEAVWLTGQFVIEGFGAVFTETVIKQAP